MSGVSSSFVSSRREVLLLAGAAAASVLVTFLAYEAVERAFIETEESRRLLHYGRGISASLVTAAAVGFLAHQQHGKRARSLAEEAERAARDARDARALLGFIVDATPSALIVLDPECRVVQTNRTAELVHGTELTGKLCRDAVAACSTLCAACPAAATLATGLPRTDLPPHTDPRTGEVLSIESHPLELPDGQRRVLLVEQVITAQKKLQARLLHQEKMAAFGLLAAGIAHDLGNPLASIEAQIQLLDAACLDPETASVLTSVREDARRLGRMIRELVDFARRRRDEATLVSVQAVAEDALRIAKHDPRMRKAGVKCVFDPETPPVLMVEDHLVQVVLNLVLNALDAMEEGGTLEIEVASGNQRVILRVTDSGCGMDSRVLERCFEPLFTTKPQGRGTGLGLSISRDIIRESGGELELHSSPGRGTSALVFLPAASMTESSAEGPGLP